MKNVKKFMSLMIAVVMVLAMAVTTFAAGETPSITIQPNNDDEDTTSLAITYTYYKILTASIDTDPVVNPETGETTTEGTASYYVEDKDQADALEATGLFNVVKVDGETKWYVELSDAETTAQEIIDAFNNATFLGNFTEQTYTKPAGTADAVLPGITAGYYFIESSLGTKIAVQTLSPVTINEKNSYPTIVKTMDENSALAGIGDTVTYTIKVTIPDSVAEKEMRIVDTITNGLTLNTAVTVAGATAESAYTSATFVQTGTVEATETAKAATVYTLTIPAATVIANKGKTLTFTYTATVNENAIVLDPEINKAHLEYDEYVTVDTEVVETETLAFTLQKVDGTDKTTVLTGAQFELYDAATGGNKINLVKVSDGEYRVATAAEAEAAGFESALIDAGTATINGLNDATYYLEETKAPTSYNKLEARKEIAVTEATSAEGVDVKVENNKGTTLPSTGGIGTTLFYVIGAALVLGSGVLMVSKKRMGAN
ncbi:MAG: SpaH/EbpB family LPXTG-anchored major pilin [Erysipelotrichaceae bacterium]|nr:SpaH/EbpB family LPXTG-anchored major pilin [Erysipelotrichaceae bacterium]